MSNPESLSNPSETLEPQSRGEPSNHRSSSKTLEQEDQNPHLDSAQSEKVSEAQDENKEEEEEGECGFCLFMKAGGCRESFIAWEQCIEEAEKNKEDIVEKCFQVTGALKKCMEAHADYYEPILRAEKAAEEEAIKQLDKDENGDAKDSAKENATSRD